MADPFVAEIRIVGFNFPPTGWAYCNGQLLAISQNTALFSLLGTMYGGDGKSTFALPDMQDRAPTMPDGTSSFDQGVEDGSSTVTLLQSEIPVHNHNITATNQPAQLLAPGTDRIFARSSGGTAYQQNSSANLVNMEPNTLTITGGSSPHNNMQPFLTMNFVIALQGVFPPRG